ncbi:hypothetical protein [Alkaliphilus sp. B6464]|uniref:hypothetical protein n=1 Tax=Alkaliphilus sp. B6464 TaxID=2731219 RepID=UPI001BAAF3A8|nr:hypothetical protein [Alkaliphilus sp. B6464]QUH21906.1 hypothetical protein HYG84_18390 [Alkaliphilus sp. B6464]
MNIKKHIQQIYEFRIIQSTKAIIDGLINNIEKYNIGRDEIVNLQDDKCFIDYFYYKLLTEEKIIKSRDIDVALSLYLKYTAKLNSIYGQSFNEDKSQDEKLIAYLIINSCVKEYLNLEIELCNKYKTDTSQVSASLRTSDSVAGILNTLIFKEVKEKEDNLSEKDKQILEDIYKICEKWGDIDKLLSDTESFLEDYLDNIIYTIQIEYQDQVNYTNRLNEKILIDVNKSLKKLLFDIKNITEE